MIKTNLVEFENDLKEVLMLYPEAEATLTASFFDGKMEEAKKMQLKLYPLVKALFCEVNPIPVKSAMAAMGFCEDYLRLPLTPMEDATRAVLYAEMRKLGLQV